MKVFGYNVVWVIGVMYVMVDICLFVDSDFVILVKKFILFLYVVEDGNDVVLNDL